ncbi:hypothetical protein [Spirosoma panaciterrae]|uniref:hypothetical protein n=1 Tax=Spirosoma panaciterrae TaxID=496058 RepID=UPI00035D7C23|nr:hypothetical protein [Spirosoma panaciterrae]
MKPLTLPYLCLAIFIVSSLSATLQAQKLTFDVYRARVITMTGERYRGVLEEVSDTDLRLTSYHGNWIDEEIPLRQIRKVVIRRISKKRAIITGSIIGGLAAGFASYKSLQRNQTSNDINYGITLTFAAAGGAAAGLVVGSFINNVTGRVIRPLDITNPELSLYRQLEPFTYRHQQNLIKRLPNIPQ